jgi:hypothetical protein
MDGNHWTLGSELNQICTTWLRRKTFRTENNSERGRIPVDLPLEIIRNFLRVGGHICDRIKLAATHANDDLWICPDIVKPISGVTPRGGDKDRITLFLVNKGCHSRFARLAPKGSEK